MYPYFSLGHPLLLKKKKKHYDGALIQGDYINMWWRDDLKGQYYAKFTLLGF